MKKVLLFNPPVGLYQRSEDRCQANIAASSIGSIRACNDLGYMAAVLRNLGFEAKIADYPIEKQNWNNYIKDLEDFKPDIAIMSITTASLNEDMEAFKIAKKLNPAIITIAKGAHFLSCTSEELGSYKTMNYAISGEAEFIIQDLIQAIRGNRSLQDIKGIFYWNEDRSWFIKTEKAEYREDLDSLPFPARDLMNNKVYVRPDTGKPMATISVARGCPFPCIYCLTPIVSGKKVRKRSSLNIVDEIQECVEKYGIMEFFFKADTFTVDKEWVTEVCEEILKRGLKIGWGANSRVKPLSSDTLNLMKKAGCWLVAFGVESGNEESLQKMGKGITKQEIENAIKWAKEAGLKVSAYYLFGFPWETKEHIEETIKFAKKLDCDFAEFHLAVPFEGTELYEQVKNTRLLTEEVTGHDSFINPVMKTNFLGAKELLELKNRANREIILRPAYIIKTLKNIKSIDEFMNYTKFGLRLLKNMLIR